MKLFDRHADAVRLTAGGERLLARAYRLLALNDDVIAEMSGADFTGEVRLGAPPDIVGMLLPPILRAFTKAYPSLLVTLVSATTEQLIGQLEQGAVDLAILTEAKLGAQAELLLTDRLVWVGERGGEAHCRRPLSVALGAQQSEFRSATVNALSGAGIEWRPVCQVGSLEPVFATLEADMAVATFLAGTVPSSLASIEDGELPALPPFHVTLRMSSADVSGASLELAGQLREGLARRYG